MTPEIFNVQEQKRNLRKQMLAERAKFPKFEKAQYDQRICETLLKEIGKNQFKNIHCYLPMGTEINIFPLIEILLVNGLTVVVPKTLSNRRLKSLILKSLDELEEGAFGTSHPAAAEEYRGEYDLIIVPGLAFDANNYRLGYGGGYYDDFLSRHKLAKKIGIFYPFQKVEKIPLESHDVKLDEILIAG